MYVLCTYLHGRYGFIRESIINIHIQSLNAKVLWYCYISLNAMLFEDYVRIIIAIFVTCDHVYFEPEILFYNFRGRRQRFQVIDKFILAPLDFQKIAHRTYIHFATDPFFLFTLTLVSIYLEMGHRRPTKLLLRKSNFRGFNFIC
jgi:hypothetical protein